MAEEQTAKDGQEAVESSPQKSNTTLIILVAVLITIILAGTAVSITFMLMSDDKPTEKATESISEVTQPAASKAEAMYVASPKPFTVNLAFGSKRRMLSVRMYFMVRSNEAKDNVKQHMPKLQNHIIDLLSGITYEEIVTNEGKQQLRDDTLAMSQAIMEEITGKPSIENVLFTNFVMQ